MSSGNYAGVSRLKSYEPMYKVDIIRLPAHTLMMIISRFQYTA